MHIPEEPRAMRLRRLLKSAEQRVDDLGSSIASGEEFDERILALCKRLEDFLETTLMAVKETPPATSQLYERWTEYRTWTIAEAVALAVRRSPNAQMSPFQGLSTSEQDLGFQAEHALRAGKLDDPVSPLRFLEWLTSIGFAVPSDMKRLIEQKVDIYNQPAVSAELGMKQPGVPMKTFHSIQILLTHLLLKGGLVELNKHGRPQVSRKNGDKLEAETKEWGAGLTGKPICEHSNNALSYCWNEIVSSKLRSNGGQDLVGRFAGK